MLSVPEAWKILFFLWPERDLLHFVTTGGSREPPEERLENQLSGCLTRSGEREGNRSKWKLRSKRTDFTEEKWSQREELGVSWRGLERDV